MARVWKQIIAPGTYWIGERPVQFSEADVQHMHDEGKRMLEAGLPIRVPEEHVGYANPIPLDDDEAKAKDVKFNRGFVGDYALDPQDKSLWAGLDIGESDPTLAPRLKDEIKYVSPRILPEFRDGAGKVWKDCIAHVALTAQPIWHGQKPFGTPFRAGGVAMSLKSLRKRAGKAKGMIDFSMAARLVKRGDKWEFADKAAATPPKPKGAINMAEDTAAKADEKPEGGGAQDRFEEAKKALADKGIQLPDHVTHENVLDHLVTALANHDDVEDEDLDDLKPHEENEDHTNAEDDDAAGEDAMANAQEEPMTVSLSRGGQSYQGKLRLRTEHQPAKPKKKVDLSVQQKEINELKAGYQKMQARAAKGEFESHVEQINRHYGRGALSPANAKAFVEILGRKQLSLVQERNDPEVAKVMAKLELAAELPDNSVWDTRARLDLSNVPDEPAYGFTGSAKRQQEAGKTLTEMALRGRGVNRNGYTKGNGRPSRNGED